jgi:hypothetical protein
MGRLASALDWTDGKSGSERSVSEIRLQTVMPPAADERSDADETADFPFEDDEPTVRFLRTPTFSPEEPPKDSPEDPSEQAAARGIARLSALARWIEGEGSSKDVVGFVRTALHELAQVHAALAALRQAAVRASVPEGFDAAVQGLTRAVGLWRANLVEHIDELALSDHRSFVGWSSLPEYSLAYTLAVVKPVLESVEDWAVAWHGTDDELVSSARLLAACVARVNDTLRRVSASGNADARAGEARRSLAPTVW